MEDRSGRAGEGMYKRSSLYTARPGPCASVHVISKGVQYGLERDESRGKSEDESSDESNRVNMCQHRVASWLSQLNRDITPSLGRICAWDARFDVVVRFGAVRVTFMIVRG